MEKRERENAAMVQHSKNWELLTREVKTLTQQNIELMNQNQEIINALKKWKRKSKNDLYIKKLFIYKFLTFKK